MLDRTQAPSFVKSSSFDLIRPERTTVAGGAEVLFVLGGSQNVCKIELLFQAGRWNERSFGAGYFTSQLLSKGTKTKSSFQIAQAFDQLGAHLEINPGADFVSVALYSLTRKLESSFELLVELLLDSVFPEKELAQLKTIYLQNLRINKEKTSFQSSVLFRRTLYGSSHPYGKELDDTDVQRISQAELVKHFNEFFKEATVIVSGKVSEEQQQYIVSSLGFLKQQVIAPADATIPVLNVTSEIISKEGSVQASIRMGKPFFGRLHADYAGAILLNHMLGGYFGSRLMKNIREEKGLTYGISSSLSMALHGNHFVIGADVNLENVQLAFGEIRKEMKRLREEAIDPGELEIARNHFIGSLQLEITTSFAHADKVKNIKIFGLPDTYYQQLIHRIDAISAEYLMEVANRHFQEEQLLQIAVG
ncbi:pitrilysin family protein [Chryseolinea sp. T2]|uniref:M16 family metallopeptidase n=1 Tax=Chryseolinea sp. T2 TaxID=3129255 RepID=UPI003076DFE2